MDKQIRFSFHKLKNPADLVAAVALLIIAVFLVCFIFRYIRCFLIGLEYVQQYNQVTAHEYEMIVLRNEYLVEAGDAGEFTPSLESGQRVKEGTVVGNTAALQVKAPHPGLVYYDTDGWEEILRPEATNETDWSRVLELLIADLSQHDDAASEVNLSAGRCVARIVDNLTDVSVFLRSDWISPDLEVGDIVRFYSDETYENTYQARITEYGTLKDGSSYLIATVLSSDDWFYSIRYAQVYVSGENINGIAVPVNAVVYDDNTQVSAVYRLDGLTMNYTPVTIICQLDDVFLVEGLQETDQIATRPWFVRDGQKILARR